MMLAFLGGFFVGRAFRKPKRRLSPNVARNRERYRAEQQARSEIRDLS